MMDFLKLAPLLMPTGKPIGAVIDCAGPAYDRFLQPLMLAVSSAASRHAGSAPGMPPG